MFEETGLDLATFALANLGDVQIDERRVKVAMTKVSADLPDRDAIFKQMGGEAVAQGVTAGVFL